LVPACWPTHVCDPGCWSLGLPGTVAAAGASMLVVPVETSVLLEPDFAHVGCPMVHLYTLHQQAVLATLDHF